MNIAASCHSESGRYIREEWVFKSVPKLLCAFFMCQKAANNLLYLAVLTSLLDKAGANALPWVYLLVNVIFIGIQFRVMTRLAGREGHWLLRVLSLPAALMAFVAAWFFLTDMVPVLTGFYPDHAAGSDHQSGFYGDAESFHQHQRIETGAADDLCRRQLWFHSQRSAA